MCGEPERGCDTYQNKTTQSQRLRVCLDTLFLLYKTYMLKLVYREIELSKGDSFLEIFANFFLPNLTKLVLDPRQKFNPPHELPFHVSASTKLILSHLVLNIMAIQSLVLEIMSVFNSRNNDNVQFYK